MYCLLAIQSEGIPSERVWNITSEQCSRKECWYSQRTRRIKFPKKRCGSATETDNVVLEVYTSSRLPAFSEEYRKEKIYKYMGFSELKFWLLRWILENQFKAKYVKSANTKRCQKKSCYIFETRTKWARDEDYPRNLGKMTREALWE